MPVGSPVRDGLPRAAATGRSPTARPRCASCASWCLTSRSA